jgi:hypothetical protein
MVDEKMKIALTVERWKFKSSNSPLRGLTHAMSFLIGKRE